MSNLPWKLLAGPLALIAFLAVGYPVYWHYAAARLERAVAAWLEARRGEGWSATHGRPAVEGFPLRLRLTLPDLALAADPDGWRWRSRRAALELQPWDWRRFRVVAAGPQILELRIDGDWRRFGVEAAETAFVGGIRGGAGLVEGAFELRDAKLRDAADRQLARAGALRLWLRESEARAAADGSLSLALRVSEANVTERLRLPLGQTVARFDLDARLRGGLPRDFGAIAVEAWRRRGGAVEIEASDLRWGPAGVRVAGTVMLDEQMRPAGSLRTELQGYAEMLATLEAAHAIRPRDAATVRIALDLLARPGPDGARVVSLPVTARNGALYLGPIRAARLPPIPFWARSVRRSLPGASR